MQKHDLQTLSAGIVILAAIGGAIILLGPKQNTPSQASSSAAAATTAPTVNAITTNAVTIDNYMFSPMAITVKTGTTVTWTNKDDVYHTVTADNGGMPMSAPFDRGETYQYTFTKAGTYTYHCTPHPYMKAEVIVTN
jgi:plastocyanin